MKAAQHIYIKIQEKFAFLDKEHNIRTTTAFS